MSVASRKMTAYAKTDCIGASKGLFFGLLTLVLGLICLILFFVLIDHDNQQVSDTNYISAAFMYSVLPTMAFFKKKSMIFFLIFTGFAAGSVLSRYFSLCYSIGLDTSHFLRLPKVNPVFF